MIADSVRHLDQLTVCDARPVAARTLDDLIGQMRDIMRTDDPLIDGLPVSAATAGEKSESAVQVSV
jgi:hypothetical protein